jgi:hypothetical protein
MRTNQIRQQLHDYIDSAEDKMIRALYTLLEAEILETQLIKNSKYDYKDVNLTEEQILMLQLSDKDIEAGNLTPHDDVTKRDLDWLKEL